MKLRAAVAATALTGSSLLAVASSAGADDTVEPTRCDNYISTHIDSVKARHMPGNAPIYKNGPAPSEMSMTMTNQVGGSVSTSFSGEAEGGFDVLVASAKAKIGVSVNITTNWSNGMSITFEVPKGKYGNAQYGSWGKTITWSQWKQHENCTVEQIHSGTGKVARKAKGFNTWLSND